MLESCCPSQRDALEKLERVAPDVPFLALGQTVFWDEPLKIGVKVLADALGHRRRFVAGVHDTDYFAKLHKPWDGNEFVALPHNDTTTKAIWSAAGEFSTLFGSETVVTRDMLLRSRLKLHRIETHDPALLDKMTEAWGWRGVVSTSPEPMVAGQVPLGPVFDVMNLTFGWAISETLQRLPSAGEQSRNAAINLQTIVCDASEPREGQSLGDFFTRLLPQFQRQLTGEQTASEITRTSELLKFNTKTCHEKRFEIVERFLRFDTRGIANACYDNAIAASEIYKIERFGTGAIPFDLVVPGQGRGTLRVGKRGIVVGTPIPIGISLKKPIESIAELAEVIERRLGENCALVGKAVTLITMLSHEFVFVFHEGGSGYVSMCREFHDSLQRGGIDVELNPILRVRYSPWETIGVVDGQLALPPEMAFAFGMEVLSTSEFASQRKDASLKCKILLQRLADLKKPIELLSYFSGYGDEWTASLRSYLKCVEVLEGMRASIEAIKERKRMVAAEQRAAKKKRVEAEIAKGKHFRAMIFDKEPSEADLSERQRLTEAVDIAISEIRRLKREWYSLDAEQSALVQGPDIRRAMELRNEIEFKAETFRMELIRNAIVSSDGLEKSGLRPSAWWFPIVSPDGEWFKETIEHAQWYLEPLEGTLEPI